MQSVQRPLIDMGTTSKVEHFDRVVSYFMTQSVLKLKAEMLGGGKVEVKTTINKPFQGFAHGDGWSECLCKTVTT